MELITFHEIFTLKICISNASTMYLILVIHFITKLLLTVNNVSVFLSLPFGIIADEVQFISLWGGLSINAKVFTSFVFVSFFICSKFLYSLLAFFMFCTTSAWTGLYNTSDLLKYFTAEYLCPLALPSHHIHPHGVKYSFNQGTMEACQSGKCQLSLHWIRFRNLTPPPVDPGSFFIIRKGGIRDVPMYFIVIQAAVSFSEHIVYEIWQLLQIA